MTIDMATILCVDDEESILRALRRVFRKEPYRILTAGSSAEALQILKDVHPWVIISDQRMPGMDGITFLKKVRETHPDVIRITLTGYTEVETIKEAVNQGHIFKFLIKPWDDENLILDIRQAVSQYKLMMTNRELNNQVMTRNEELQHLNEHLESLVRQRTEDLRVRNQALEFSQAILSDLPVPLIGVGADGMIAMTNCAVNTLFKGLIQFEPGRFIEECFKPEMLKPIRQVLSGDRPHAIECDKLGGISFLMQCVPLSGRFKGRGVVLAFQKT